MLGAVVLNNLYLEKFYLYKKGSQLEEVSKIVLSKNIDEESLFELEDSYGVLMDVVTLEELRLLSGKFFTTAGKEVYKELVKKGDSVEVIQYMGIKHIMFYKLFDKTRVIRIMTSIQPLEEAIGIANELYLYTGLIVMRIGFFVSLIFSKTLVKPIIVINRTIKKISQMDFSETVDIKTNDELIEVVASINLLSNELEKNISELNAANEKLRVEIDRKKNR